MEEKAMVKKGSQINRKSKAVTYAADVGVTGQQTNRNYKDGIFRTLFNDKEKLLELYNALEGKNLGPETDIQIVTLDSVIYMDIKNDVAFTVDGKFIVVAEHQSSYCPNICVRMLSYIGRTYERLYSKASMYGTVPVKIAAPEFYVFYNGGKELPNEYTCRLSDNFVSPAPENSAELVAKLINIRYNEGAEILKHSQTMKEYSLFIHYVYDGLAESLTLEEAAAAAIRRCMDEKILTDFLQKYGGEVTSMLFMEVTREEYGKAREHEGYERGIERGIAQGRESGLHEGKETGLREGKQEIARNLKLAGIDPAIIAKTTGLDAAQIEKL